ncbi:MAG: ATP-binding protein, partial [Bacteroidota bacterium]
INDILDLAKIEAGKIELEVIDFSLRDVVDQVIQTMYFKAEEKGLSLIRSIPESVPDVLTGDPVRLNQILMNLTGNAIKFTDRGSVELRVEQVNQGSNSPVMLKFSVTDTGVGIPHDKLGSVFEEYSQARASDTRRFGGTGLGLTIANHLVSLMNGRISVESQPGHGFVFSFKLTFLPGSADKLKLQQDAEMNLDGSILDGLSLLLADDNDYNLVVAADTLRSKCNVTIKTATNGQEAIDLLMENEFDIVLMDVQMPVMNGFEATQYIRNKIPPPKHRIPVLALTASVLRSELDNCRDAGMNGFIPKPFTAAQLIKGVAEALNIPFRYAESEKSSARQPLPAKKEMVTDLTYLEKFCEGDRPRMKKYIGMFLAAVPGFREKILTALESANHTEIASQIHGFKTKWVMMGMHETKILADNIEKQCREEIHLNEVTANVMKLLRQIELAKSELHGN